MKDGWRLCLVAAVLLAFGGVRLAQDSLDAQRSRLSAPDDLFTRAYRDMGNGYYQRISACKADCTEAVARDDATACATDPCRAADAAWQYERPECD